MNKQELITELRTLGGFPEEVIENKELFDFFEPVLRADFELAENHVEIGSQLHIPIIALMGSKEKDMNRISNWQRFTSSDFQFEIMDGDHFFIYKNPQRIARIIQQYNEQRAIVL
jgi:surfactin synthase thioesterase subunit